MKKIKIEGDKLSLLQSTSRKAAERMSLATKFIIASKVFVIYFTQECNKNTVPYFVGKTCGTLYEIFKHSLENLQERIYQNFEKLKIISLTGSLISRLKKDIAE